MTKRQEQVQVPPIREEITAPSYLRLSKVIAYLLYAWVTVGVIVLGLRVFLLAFSANATTPFVQFIYNTSADYLAPFRGIFSSRPLGETGYFDVAAIFAVVMYLLLSWGISSLVNYIQYKIDANKLEQKQRIRELENAEARAATT
ncbi:MAG: hypothetical protein WAS27_04170 [Candidatus Saccharimonadales bacterium]